MSLHIRTAQHADAAGIINSHRRSIREVCGRDYSPAQIEAWAGRDFREERWRQTIDRDAVWVISDDKNNIYGFAHLAFSEGSAELMGLYFLPEACGLGFGRKMMDLILDGCREKAVAVIRLTSTKTARDFYARHGFQQEGDITAVSMGSEAIGCYKMQRAELDVNN